MAHGPLRLSCRTIAPDVAGLEHELNAWWRKYGGGYLTPFEIADEVLPNYPPEGNKKPWDALVAEIKKHAGHLADDDIALIATVVLVLENLRCKDNPRELVFADRLTWAARALGALEGKQESIRKASKRMLDARHKDSRADKAFIQRWYQENRAKFPSKDAAATHAFENRLVTQTWRVIRGYLNNV